MKKANISVFVPHIGCPHKCSFCNQNTITGNDFAPTANDVKDAIEIALKNNDYDYEIAFFGGSFTAIDREYMTELLDAAYPYVESGKISGIRCSTRPDFIDEEILTLLKKYRVTSIELGAQSMSDEVLLKNMRGHSSNDVRNASKLIKDFGFELGLQMMTGLWDSSKELDVYTAKEIIKLNPKTVRIYPTVVLKNTYLGTLAEKGIFVPDTLEETISLCAQIVPLFEEKNIRIIRLGLHSSEEVKKNMLGGGYHDSLGELVRSRIFLNKILEYPPKTYDVFINEKSISKLIGQKKANITALKNAGYEINIKYNNSLSVNELEVK